MAWRGPRGCRRRPGDADHLIYDDLDECRVGAELRFIFDHNMEFANAFPSQVDCLTLYVYDKQGNYVETRTETTDVLADEEWRMIIDLPAGDYHMIAYGGTACDQASYTTVTPQPGQHYTAMGHAMKPEHLGTHLHDLYYACSDKPTASRPTTRTSSGRSPTTTPAMPTTTPWCRQAR